MELQSILESKEKILTESAILGAGDDFMKKIKNFPEFQDKGYVKFLLDDNLKQKFTISEKDIDLKKITSCGLVSKEKNLKTGVYGVRRDSLEDMKIGQVLKKRSQLVGDELMDNITKSKKGSIFEIIFNGSLLNAQLLGKPNIIIVLIALISILFRYHKWNNKQHSSTKQWRK